MGVIKGSANLSELAERLGISISTVSRALRGLKGVHPATRSRIMKVADELGYLRNEEAAEKSRTILVLAQASGADRVQDYLSGVSCASVDLNCSVLTHCLPMDRCGEMLDPVRQPAALREGRVDGLLLICKWPDEVVAELARKTPLVSLIHQYPAVTLDRVGIDNECGMGRIVGHLAKLGHRKIGFFGVHPSVTWARSRYGAYVEALMSQGLEVAAGWAVPVSEKDALDEELIDASAYIPKVKALISSGVTAMVCSGDLLCYGLMIALINEGLRVPEDISLTGFHIQSPRQGLPQLTSVSLPSEALGAAALRRMVRRLESPDETFRTILIPCELVIGSSTGVPAT